MDANLHTAELASIISRVASAAVFSMAVALVSMPHRASAQNAAMRSQPRTDSRASQQTSNADDMAIVDAQFELGYLSFREGPDMAAQLQFDISTTRSTVWSVRAVAGGQLCIDHEHGFCPWTLDFSGTWGKSWRARFGHATLAVGPTAGYYDPNYIGPPRSDGHDAPGATIGALAVAEAFFTPSRFFGLGVEIPLRLNNRTYGWGVMTSLEFGRLGVSTKPTPSAAPSAE